MRFEFQSLKNLRAHFLKACWRVRGIPAPRAACHEKAPQLLVEEAVQQTFPRRTMLGHVDKVPKAVAEMFQSGLISAEDRDFWDGQSTVTHPPGGLSFVDAGSVVGKRGILISPAAGVLDRLGGGPLASLLGEGPQPTHLPPPKKVGGDLLVLTRGIAQRNYFHWTFELLAQLRLLKRAGVHFDYVAVPKRHRFAKDSLELFGVQPRKILRLDRYTHLAGDRLIVPSCSGRFPHPAGVAYLRETMQCQSWSRTGDLTRLRLYISRGRLTLRRVVNERELVTALRPLGFQSVRLERLSVKQQIQLFQRAEAVVGPHGAGFSNLAYCRPGTLALEISATSRPRLYFYYLAATNKLRYAIYFATPTNHPDDSSNITVNVPDLMHHLSRLLETT